MYTHMCIYVCVCVYDVCMGMIKLPVFILEILIELIMIKSKNCLGLYLAMILNIVFCLCVAFHYIYIHAVLSFLS